MATKQIKGVLGEKLGMTQVFDDAGKVVPVTVLKAGPCVVSRIRTPDTDGYSAIQLGYGQVNPRKVNKPLGDHPRKHDLTPTRPYVAAPTAPLRARQPAQGHQAPRRLPAQARPDPAPPLRGGTYRRRLRVPARPRGRRRGLRERAEGRRHG